MPRVDEKFLAQVDQALTGWSDPAARLQAALEKNELTLYCQPIRALIGPPGFPIAEALVRLREEENALLPPGEFLPVFEHYRMMPQLDRWVLRSVLRRLRQGSKVPRFSVNLSEQTLDDAQFPASVAAELKATGVSAECVLFELDEPDVLGKPEAVARFVSEIRKLGCGVMIDGFGRRSVSFAPLKTLRIDFIKVDGSITRKILKSETADSKLRAVLRVGEATGIGVIAECVEEQDVLTRVKALGVGYAQGFGVIRPHPIDSIAA
jgi:EAL domain-containing protein (putative c-di-GMP-specific phosphodiesterase class I)